jgi:hypothetical protein
MSRIDNGSPDFVDELQCGIIVIPADDGLRWLAVETIANLTSSCRVFRCADQ